MKYVGVQIPQKGQQMMIFQKSSGKISFLQILWVFEVETRLTVYRLLDIIPKQLCRPKGFSGQRLSGRRTPGKLKSKSEISWIARTFRPSVSTYISVTPRLNIRRSGPEFYEICQGAKIVEEAKNGFPRQFQEKSYFIRFYRSFRWKPG